MCLPGNMMKNGLVKYSIKIQSEIDINCVEQLQTLPKTQSEIDINSVEQLQTLPKTQSEKQLQTLPKTQEFLVMFDVVQHCL